MREAPREYLCPITQDVMQEPVIAGDGYTYEKAAISSWLSNARNKNLSPITRQVLDINNLIINRNLKDLIETYNKSLVESANENQNPIANSNIQNEVKVTHIELMNNMIAALEVDNKEVYQGTIVEQTIVALAGIYVSQKEAMFRRDNMTGHTNFILCFTNLAEHQKFLLHYKTNYASSILDGGIFTENKVKIIFNTNILNDLIIPAIADYKKNSHQIAMEQLSNSLGVSFDDVFNGSAVEQSLVRKAGINTSQENAYFRRQEDYTTKFSLSFANEAEYKKFTDYYQENYPNFIIRKGNYMAGGSTSIDVSTRILLNIAPQLAVAQQNSISI